MAPVILESVNSTILNSSLITNLTQSATLAASTIATGLIRTATECTGSVATSISAVVLRNSGQEVHVVGGSGLAVIGAIFPFGFLALYFSRRRQKHAPPAATAVPYGYQTPYYYATPGSPPPAFIIPASPQPAKHRAGPPAVFDPMTGGYYTYGYAAQPQRHVSFGGTQVRRYG